MARLVRFNEYEASVVAEALKHVPKHVADMFGNGDLARLRFKMDAVASGTPLRKRIKKPNQEPTAVPEIAVEPVNVPV